MRTVLLVIVRAYRAAVSPLLPRACRFVPSCSAYAEDALRTHGAARGIALAVRRLLRCHPWGGSGYDPVPMSAGAEAPLAGPSVLAKDAGSDRSSMRTQGALLGRPR